MLGQLAGPGRGHEVWPEFGWRPHAAGSNDVRILLIEDDPMIGKSLVQALADEGMSVDWVRDGQSGLEAIGLAAYAVVLLDLGLPKMDGAEVLARARKAGRQAPIVVITARDDIASRISGLDLGADDYIVKPFEIGELLARMRAVQRRRAGQAQSRLQAGELALDLGTHEVTFRGHGEILPAREFALVWALAERPNMILSKAQLEEKLYGWGQEVESNAIDVLIHYVRRKFDKDIIRNVRGAGWMIAKEP